MGDKLIDILKNLDYNKITHCVRGWDMNSKEQLIKLRKETGMNRKQFCEYFGIPYRTMTDWELGNRQMPEYLLRLMKYKVEMEKHMERST